MKKAYLIWATGIPCSGKTTLMDELSKELNKMGIGNQRLDGDIVRGQLWRDLGFSKKDRDENLRRVTELSKLFLQHNLWVLASFVSPYREVRKRIKKEVNNKFVEIYLSCSPKKCAERDCKGMWKKAKEGKIKGFTGYDAPYEESLNWDIIVYTGRYDVTKCITKILAVLKRKELL